MERELDLRLVYLIGAPGAGKTTLMAEALGEPSGAQASPIPHLLYPSGVVQIGAVRDAFAGTDALSMNIQPDVLRWLESRPGQVVVGEGDRLSNGGFFAGVAWAGYRLVVVHLRALSVHSRSP